MIRILHVMDKLSVDGSSIHGPARQLSYRLPFYDPERFGVLLCNLRSEDDATRLLREVGIEVVCLDKGKLDPRTLVALHRLIKQWRPDVLHLHGYGSWNFGRIAGRMAGLPVVVQEHFIGDTVPWYQRLADRALRGWDTRRLAVAEAVKRFMIEKRSVREPIEVLWNGVPFEGDHAPDPADAAAVREELSVPADAPLIGIVGRLAEMKGHRYFLDAAARIAESRLEARFLILGEGPLREALQQQARDLGLADRVVFTGYRTDAVRCLAACDVGVVASIFGEGFCTVAIETFLAETPLVITDLPCFEGLYIDDENVRMVPTRDAPAIARAVQEIMDDPDLARRLTEGGRRRLRDCRMQKIAGQYMDLYESVVGPEAGVGAAAGAASSSASPPRPSQAH